MAYASATQSSFPTPGLVPGGREFSTEDYFKTQRPPAHLADKTAAMDKFVKRWAAVPNKKVVLVTVSREWEWGSGVHVDGVVWAMSASETGNILAEGFGCGAHHHQRGCR
jgi:hypothetical protein